MITVVITPASFVQLYAEMRKPDLEPTRQSDMELEFATQAGSVGKVAIVLSADGTWTAQMELKAA